MNEIHAQVAEETRRSRYRDRVSRQRVHPAQHDLNKLINFALERRLRQPGVTDLVRRVMRRVDTEALRLLVDIVQNKGATDWTTRHRCRRLLGYCDTIESAMEVDDEI